MGRNLTASAVIRWHDRLIRRYGGSLGVRDLGLLASALAAPRQISAYGSRDSLVQAAGLCYAVANNHAFLDGNKRTAFACLDIFLRRRGLRLRFAVEWVDIIEGVADGSVDRDELVVALRRARARR